MITEWTISRISYLTATLQMLRTNFSTLAPLFVLCIVLLVGGCASNISNDTVRLSSELTIRTKDMEAAHIEAVNRFFDSEKRRIEDFLELEWFPLFLRNFVGRTRVLDDLRRAQAIDRGTRNELEMAAKLYLFDPEEAPQLAEKIADALTQSRMNEPEAIRRIVSDFVPGDDVDSAVAHFSQLVKTENEAVIMMQFAEAANVAIQTQRKSLFSPLEAARQQTLGDIQAAYSDLYAAQATITGRLEAARKLNEEQQRLFDKLSGQEGAAEKIRSRLSGLGGKLDNIARETRSLSMGEGRSPESVADHFHSQLVEVLENAGFNVRN